MIKIVIVSAVVVVVAAAAVFLLHSFPFFLFFLCLFFKHFTTITRPFSCHAHFSYRVPIHTCTHARFTCAAAVFIFFCCCCCTHLLISNFCVCVFLVLRLFFVDFLCFFTLLATFRLIKDNSVIIIVFFLCLFCFSFILLFMCEFSVCLYLFLLYLWYIIKSFHIVCCCVLIS